MAVAIAVGCVPDVTFVHETPEADHCTNEMPDPAQGETDRDCGGPDCDPCQLGQACSVLSDCAEGDCLGGICMMPGCDNGVQDGGETGPDCGNGCMPCPDGTPCVSPTDCVSKSCNEGHCAAPACDDSVLNGYETTRDCGGGICDGCPIDAHCEEDTDCISLLCDPTTKRCVLNCTGSSADCDGEKENECETNLFTSNRNCGECGNQCDLPHASVMCVGGVCQIDKCDSPWDRCDTDETNGCETNLSNDVMNCGACGVECPAEHGTASCVQGKCQIDSCDKGYDNCDEDPSNGCEASVNNDVLNCLKCGEVCDAPDGAEPYCTIEDGCGFSDCEAGRGNCAGDPSGECANDLTKDPKNCGRCGNACSVVHGSARCEAGVCVIDTCDDGWDNCNSGDDDGGYSDGCEVNTDQSADNCGGCGNSCDVDHGDGTCQGGACGIVSCADGYENCDTTAAGGGFANGCETNLASDRNNCGACGNDCTGTHATMDCVDKECVQTGCEDDFADCTAAEGCETDTSSSTQHCGSCTGVCSNAGATTVKCSGGSCAAPVCDSTHLNCDGNNANGCEATLGTTASCNACPQNGGACTTALPSCVLSGSTYHCQATITVGNAASGNINGATLTVQHNLTSGSNRLVLVAVVGQSDQGTGGLAQARPDTVTYAGVAMAKLDELAAPANPGANIYIYYLTDTGANRLPASATGNQAVVVDGSKHTPVPRMYVANAVQFNGASQTMPVVTGAATAVGANQTSISGTATVVTSGSIIYSLATAEYVTGYKTPLDSDLSSTLTMSQNVSSNTLLAYGAVTPARPAGPVTISWNWNYAPSMSAQYLVLVPPATN